MPNKKSGKNGKRGKVLDLNTKILIGIRDELRILNGKVDGHTSILEDHSRRLTAIEDVVKELARELRKWRSHFERDYTLLANAFGDMNTRVKRCEAKLFPA